MRLISKLVNTILVKSVTYYSLSDVTVIRGSLPEIRDKMAVARAH